MWYVKIFTGVQYNIVCRDGHISIQRINRHGSRYMLKCKTTQVNVEVVY